MSSQKYSNLTTPAHYEGEILYNNGLGKEVVKKIMAFTPNEDNLSKTHSANGKSYSIQKKIENSMIKLGYMQSHIGLIASMFCALIILIGLSGIYAKSSLYIWFGIFILGTLLRALIVIYYKKDVRPADHLVKWRNIFIFGAVIGGVLWGLTGSVFYSESDSLQQSLIILVLAGTTAGSVPLYSSVLAAGNIFLITALLPFIVTLFNTHHQTDLLLDATVMAYLFYLIALCRRSHNAMKETLGLQYENNSLLTNLSEAKYQLEMINKKLEQAATHDPLTNVANRNLFVTNFAQAIDRAKLNKKLLALLYLDLDNFKNINDVHGHHVGDRLLLVLTERLEEFVSSNDVIARLGGDEFTIIIEDVTNPNEVAKLAKRICQVAAAPIKIDDLELKVGVSIGIGVYPIDGDDAEKLLHVADKAMYYVKERGGNNFRFNVTLLTG
jgi:diguanylate cyclase (GGDEF)-like protein